MSIRETTSETDHSVQIAPSPSWRDAIAVYLQRRVLIVMLLGFSSGLPLAL
jgi:PAT family beta-lactamase induction signal transducer AmpG